MATIATTKLAFEIFVGVKHPSGIGSQRQFLYKPFTHLRKSLGMGLFKTGFRFGRKKSSDTKQAEQDPGESALKASDAEGDSDEEESEQEDDPLNLRPLSARPSHRPGEAPPVSRPESAKSSLRPSSAGVRRGDVDADTSNGAAGALSARTTARHPTEGWKDVNTAVEAINFMGSVASQVGMHALFICKFLPKLPQ